MKKILLLFIVSSYTSALNASIDVKHFGAKGDGITNDQRAIDAAIRAASNTQMDTVISTYESGYRRNELQEPDQIFGSGRRIG